MERYHITNINWSTPDDVRVMAGLPDEIYASVLNINFSKYDPDDDLDYNEDFLDDVSDALTNKYGFCMMVLRLKSGGKKMSENIFGIITRFGEDDFSYWEGFSLSEEEEKQIMAILLKHDTEGFSVRGSRSDIACEIKK